MKEPYDISVPLLRIYQKEMKKKKELNKYLHMNVHSSTIDNSWKVEITQMSINKWMDKQIVVYTYNGILFSHKK